MNTTNKTRKLTIMAMLCTLSFIAVATIRFPILPLVPFLKYEPKDVIIMIGAMLYGPLSGLIISTVVSVIEMLTISSTGIIGLIMNILATAFFVCPAAFLYKKKPTGVNALLGMISGTILMTLVMTLWNYIITPIFLNISRSDVVALLVPAIIPFNLIKGTANTALTLILYKPLITALKKSELFGDLEIIQMKKSKKDSIASLLIGGFLLTSCICIFLALNGKI